MDITVKETSLRWVILSLYSFSLGCNAMMWISVSPILSIVSKVIITKTYDVSDIWVEMCSLVYMIVYVPIVFPCNYILDVYGLRVGILAGITLTTIGAWIRIGAIENFWFILIGNTLGAIGQPFLLNSPAKIAATWFRPDMRTMATTVGTMSNPLGVAVGFVLPAVFVTSDKSKSEITMLMLVEAVFCSVICVACFILFKKKPDVPPSISAGEEREEFMSSFRSCMKNNSFLLLLLAFSLVQGALNSLATLLDLISRPYGFSSFDNSIFGGLLIICGLIGAGIVGTIVTITHKYKLTSILTCLITLATFIAFIFTLSFESLIITSIGVALLGLTLTPILPISYEYGVELTYPVGEAMTGGLLNAGGQLIGIGEVGLAYLLQNSPIIILLICAGGIAIGCIAIMFSTENLKRTGIDSKQDRMISLKLPN